MEQSKKPGSSGTRAPYGSRSGKDQPDAWQPGDETPPSKRKNRREAPQGRGLKQPSGGSPTEAAARSAVRREDIAPTEVGAENKDSPTLPAFEPVPRKFRHDGWTPERQRAFIGALADTGCVSRAARYVNMSKEGAYWLRRQAGSESFRRAWEAALDLGVQRLRDELYERALEGQLKPVFLGGKLKGFKRVKSDRLLMFALRMNARNEHGQRYAASYFDPGAPRLHAGTGYSDGGERAKPMSPSPLAGEGLGRGGLPSPRGTAVGQQGISLSVPTPTRAEKDDHNAALVEHFDPVAMTLPEIEAMQAMLAEVAARRRAEENGPGAHRAGVSFIQNPDEEAFLAIGPLEDIEPLVLKDSEAEFDEDEDRWWKLE